MTDLFDPLTLAATAATIAAAVWVGHRADLARKAQREAQAHKHVGELPSAKAPGSPAEAPHFTTHTHRPWLIVPENIGGITVLAEAEAPSHPTATTFAELVLPLDACGAEAHVTTDEVLP